MDNLYSNEVQRCADIADCYTWTDSLLAEDVANAHALGLKVMIKIGVSVDNFTGPHWQIEPTDWGLWFSNYETALLKYADFCASNQVEALCIGSELDSTHPHSSEWNQLVDGVRSVYAGQLTYGSSFSRTDPDYSVFPAWGKLDIIGIQFYNPGTPFGASTYPTVAEMVAYLRQGLDQVLVPIVQQYQKPVIVTEGGCNDYDGVNRSAWNTWPSGPDVVVDKQEQTDWAEAAFQVFSGYDFFHGWFWWQMQMMDPMWRPDDTITAYDIKDQPAERAIQHWFSR